MIKSKISARVKSLECAIDYFRNCPSATTRDIKSAASEFYDFIVGHIDLPNVEPNVEDVTNSAIERVLSTYLKTDSEPKPTSDSMPSEPFKPTLLSILESTPKPR